MAGDQDSDRLGDLRVDSTGTVHPLGRDASQALRARVGEWSLLRSPPEVVFAVRAGESARTLRLAGEVRAPGALCDVVSLVAQAGWGGELVVLQEEASRSIFFESGQVVSATTTVRAEKLGEILWRFGAITRDQLDEVVRTAERSGKRVGETAIELEFVGSDELFRMMARQVEEVFYGAVHVASAMYYFFDRFDETRLVRRYNLSTGQLLMEAARRMDELRFFREKIPSDAWIPVPVASAAGRKPPPELVEVLAQCDGRRSVAEIGRRIGQLEFEVTRAVFQLATAGLVTVTAPRPEGVPAIVEAYNRAILEIHRVCDEAGSGRELRAGLEQFAMSTGVYVPLFSGAGPAEDGTLRAERIAQNVAAIAGDAGDAWLTQQLVEYAGFALFQAGSLVPREAEAPLIARVSEVLKPLRQPADGATPALDAPGLGSAIVDQEPFSVRVPQGRERDAARLGEHPDPRGRRQGEGEGHAQAARESRASDGGVHEHRSEELRPPGEVVGRAHRDAAHLGREELREQRAEAGGAAGADSEHEHRRPEQRRPGGERLPREGQRRDRAGRDDRVDGKGRAPAEAIRHDAEGRHPEELPDLRGEHPRQRSPERLAHLAEEGRQPRVAGPVRPELEDAQEPGGREPESEPRADEQAHASAVGRGHVRQVHRAARRERDESGRARADEDPRASRCAARAGSRRAPPSRRRGVRPIAEPPTIARGARRARPRRACRGRSPTRRRRPARRWLVPPRTPRPPAPGRRRAIRTSR